MLRSQWDRRKIYLNQGNNMLKDRYLRRYHSPTGLYTKNKTMDLQNTKKETGTSSHGRTPIQSHG